jgi:hypothetical protein
MDKIIDEILTRWNERYVEFGSEEFNGFLSDMNLLLRKRERLKPVYEQNKELYRYLNTAIVALTKSVYFPRYVMKPIQQMKPESLKPKKPLSERQKKILQRMMDQELRDQQQNLFN